MQITLRVPDFNGASMLKSFTTWGFVLYAALQSGIADSCTQELMNPAMCESFHKWAQVASYGMMVFGIRRRLPGPTSVAAPAAAALLALLLACAPTPTTITHYDPGTGNKLLAIQLDPTFYSRGCNAYSIDSDGSVELVTQQDGTSDWVGVRVLPSIAGDVVAVIVSAIAPTEMMKDALAALGLPTRERPPLQPPSSLHGCEGIFVNEPEVPAALLAPGASVESPEEPAPPAEE